MTTFKISITDYRPSFQVLLPNLSKTLLRWPPLRPNSPPHLKKLPAGKSVNLTPLGPTDTTALGFWTPDTNPFTTTVSTPTLGWPTWDTPVFPTVITIKPTILMCEQYFTKLHAISVLLQNLQISWSSSDEH